VDNTDVAQEDLYSKPEEIYEVYTELNKVAPGMFSIAAAFGNVHGVYKPGNVKLTPQILGDAQKYIVEKEGLKEGSKPVYFVFHGGSGSTREEIREAIGCVFRALSPSAALTPNQRGCPPFVVLALHPACSSVLPHCRGESQASRHHRKVTRTTMRDGGGWETRRSYCVKGMLLVKMSGGFIPHLEEAPIQSPSSLDSPPASGSPIELTSWTRVWFFDVYVYSYGVIKMNIDTDTQWSFWDGVREYVATNEAYLQGQIGNPEGADKPNKNKYDPRAWLRSAELATVARLMTAYEDLNAIGALAK